MSKKNSILFGLIVLIAIGAVLLNIGVPGDISTRQQPHEKISKPAKSPDDYDRLAQNTLLVLVDRQKAYYEKNKDYISCGGKDEKICSLFKEITPMPAGVVMQTELYNSATSGNCAIFTTSHPSEGTGKKFIWDTCAGGYIGTDVDQKESK